MGEDVTGAEFEVSGYENNTTAMGEPIVDGVPRNLNNIKEIDWERFIGAEGMGYFREDGLEVMSNLLLNPNIPENEFNEQMIIDAYINKNYNDPADHIDIVLTPHMNDLR